MSSVSTTAGETERPAPRLHWVNIIGISFYHVVAALAFFPYFFSWTAVIVAVAGTFVFGTIGINVFYHRYLTHKGFQSPKWFERFMAIMAICSFQDTPAHWVAVHRRHHEHADDEPDPHTPLRSFLWAHVGWILVHSPDMSRYEIYARYAKDVLRDPFLRALESQKVYLGIIVAQWFVFFIVGAGWTLLSGGTGAEAMQFGLGLVVWGVFVRTVFNWHNTWAVNSVSHMWGYRNYETDEHSRNNFVLGLTAMGEGWHNNHHADPRSARHGHRWWELDVTYWTIRLFGIVGLAWRITEPQISPDGKAVNTKPAA